MIFNLRLWGNLMVYFRGLLELINYCSCCILGGFISFSAQKLLKGLNATLTSQEHVVVIHPYGMAFRGVIHSPAKRLA